MARQLDKIDKKILFEFDKEKNLSISSLAKKIQKSKSFILYRIERMKEKKIILQYLPLIDAGKLGMYIVDIMFFIRNDGEEEIISYLKKMKGINCIEKWGGKYNLYTSFFIQNIFELNTILATITEEFKKTIIDYKTYFVRKTYTCAHNYLFEKNIPTYEPNYTIEEKVTLNKKEENILYQLSIQPDQTITELGKKLNLDIKTITKYKQNLLQKKVYLGYRPSINSRKIQHINKILLITINKKYFFEKEKIIRFLLEQKETMFISEYFNTPILTVEINLSSIREFELFERKLATEFTFKIKQIINIEKYEEIYYSYSPFS